MAKGGEEILRRTRKAIRKVVPCNALDPRVLPEEHWETFDVVLSSLCLESAACDDETYIRGVSNIASLVKPGGTLILCGVGGCSEFFCGETYFPSGDLNVDLIKDALQQAGFKIMTWIEHKMSGKTAFKTSYDFRYVLTAVHS